MFENENEGTESEVANEVESSTETQPEPKETVTEKSETEEKTTKEAQTPFHEHPRFKELVEQKNQFAEQLRTIQSENERFKAELRSFNTPKTPDKRAAMIERLKGVDPEFAEFISELAPVAEIKAMREQAEQERAQNTRTQAVSVVTGLHDQYKVSPEMRDLYNVQLEMAAARNPKLTLAQVPDLYKTVHEGMSKIVDGIKRSERESYLSSKKSSASVPSSQPKGKTAKPGSDYEYSKDPAEARSQMIKRILNQSKASDSL